MKTSKQERNSEKQLQSDMTQSRMIHSAFADSREIFSTQLKQQALMSGYAANAQHVLTQHIQRKEKSSNNTGLPDNLKAGIENLSGIAMDDVKVHYNSSKPSQLQAHAYAQGSEIHVAPGQEQHLPHEAWHVVQQKQGRVQPTTQLAGTAINDDKSLEQEADAMGDKAMQMKPGSMSQISTLEKNAFSSNIAQAASVIQLYDSVPADKLRSAISVLHGDWVKGSDERTMTVWQIAEDANWDFHFTAIYDSTGNNMTRFHFTIRHKTGSKGDDAFAWFNIIGHNKAATLGARENAGVTAYWDTASPQYAQITDIISAEFANIDDWASTLLATIVSYIKK